MQFFKSIKIILFKNFLCNYKNYDMKIFFSFKPVVIKYVIKEISSQIDRDKYIKEIMRLRKERDTL